MSEINLANNKGFVLVDEEDFEWLSEYRWFSDGKGYATTTLYCPKRTVRMHQLILPVEKGYEVDHRDGNGLNNTKENLRISTRKENTRNTRSHVDSKSAYKGVYFDISRNRWRSQIYIEGKNKHLGYFDNEYDAALSYNEASSKHHGSFARLNNV